LVVDVTAEREPLPEAERIRFALAYDTLSAERNVEALAALGALVERLAVAECALVALGKMTAERDAAREAAEAMLAPWEAHCEDCADEDGFCDVHMEAWQRATATARALRVTEQPPSEPPESILPAAVGLRHDGAHR